MKKGILTSLAFLVSLGTLFAYAYLSEFHARSNGDSIILEWKSTQESNLDSYMVERKSVNGNFVQISTVAPKGSNSYYSFEDKNAYKTSSSIYVYRLRIVDKGSYENHYSNEVTVYHSVSSVKKTWGSIKAMFR